jgi:hypothetical protein
MSHVIVFLQTRRSKTRFETTQTSLVEKFREKVRRLFVASSMPELIILDAQ